MIIGVLGRPLALIITLVFFLTTMVFGKHEVVGHLILHGVLLVFMLEGTTGPLAPPFRLHHPKPLRIAFVGVNFLLMLAGLLFVYVNLAGIRKVKPLDGHALSEECTTAGVSVPVSDAPQVALSVQPSGKGWRMDLALERFQISSAGPKARRSAEGVREGHVHLYVDGKLRGMIFSNPYELPPLPPGEHVLMVELSTPDHQTLKVDGAAVQSRVIVTQPASTDG